MRYIGCDKYIMYLNQRDEVEITKEDIKNNFGRFIDENVLYDEYQKGYNDGYNDSENDDNYEELYEDCESKVEKVEDYIEELLKKYKCDKSELGVDLTSKNDIYKDLKQILELIKIS